MKRKIILVLIAILIVVLGAYYYFDTVFLPTQFKQFVTERAEKSLNRKVSIGTINFSPLKGFIFDDITVAKIDNPEEPFLRIEQASFNFLLVPFIRKKTFIIPSIQINKPSVYIHRDKDRVWNFSDLYAKRKNLSRKDFPVVLFRKLILENGEIYFSDGTLENDFAETVTNINLNTTLSLNKGIRFLAEAQVPELKTVVKIKGNHSLTDKELTAQIQLNNVHHARYLPLINRPRPYVHFDEGFISSADLNATYKKEAVEIQGNFVADHNNIRIGNNNQMTGTIDASNVLIIWGDRKWSVKSRLKLPSMHITSSSGETFGGDVAADLDLITTVDNTVTSHGDVTIDNAYLNIGEKERFKGHISVSNSTLTRKNDIIHLKGNVAIGDTFISMDGRSSMKGNFSAGEVELNWFPSDSAEGPKLDAQGEIKIDSAEVALGSDRSISGTISAPKSSLVYDNKKITFESQGQVSEAIIGLNADSQFQGNPQFNIVFQYDVNKKVPMEYTGTVNFTESLFTGAPSVGEIKNIEGIITFKPDQIQTDGITFGAQNTDFQLSGYLTNFTDPKVDIEASSGQVEIKKLLTFFPLLPEDTDADITGKAAIKVHYKGLVKSPSDADIEASALLANTTIIHEKLQNDITGISGQLTYKKDLLTWTDLLAQYDNRSYTLTGQLADFSRPTIDTQIFSDEIDLTAQIKILNQAVQLTSFSGDYLNSSFNLKGDIHFFEESDADIDLRGHFGLDLRDIGIFIPRLKNKARQFDLIGFLTGEGLYKGTLADWRNWQLVIDAKTDKILVRNYPLKNVSLYYAQRDLAINKFDISSKIYNGDLTVNSLADLRSEEASFTSTVSLSNMDLKQLHKDEKIKNRDLSGIVSASAHFNGPINEWRNVTGNGSFNIADGYLWQWNVLNGISSILLIPEFKRLSFNEAHGDFLIRDQRIYTENTQLLGDTTTLKAKGWIDFDQNLNFNITPNFSELAILRSDSVKKKPTSILTQTEGYLNIRLTGTLDDPQHSVEKFPVKIIEETIGGTTDTLKEVIGGIVDELF